MLGEGFVCPDCVVDAVCKQSKFVKDKEDLEDIFGLRPELRSIFLKY